MDNVLVDTRKSYLDAIRWTIEIYLTEGKIPLFKKTHGAAKGMVLSPQDVDQFKLLGGFNDDWDCCYGLLVYLLTLDVSKRTTSDLKKAIDIKKFSKQITLRPLGVPQIVSLLGRPPQVMIEKIKRIFQEIYLGKDLFKIVERSNPLFWKKRGLIRKERLVFAKRILEKLRRAGKKLGITTGRSRFEVDFALKEFDLIDQFDAIMSSDEVKRAEASFKRSLRKPHPYSLIETAARINSKLKFIYVGDLPDDVLAANAAKESIDIHSVAFPALSAEPAAALAEIQAAKPDFIISKPKDLTTLLKVS